MDKKDDRKRAIFEKMNKPANIFLVLFLAFLSDAPAQTFRWAEKAGGTATDFARYIKTDNKGGFYVAGLFGNAITFKNTAGPNKVINSAGGTDIYIARFDCSRNPQWVNRIGGTQNEGGTLHTLAIEPDPTGRYIYTCGTFAGTATFGSTNGVTQAKTSYGASDGFLAKYDTSGVLIWVLSFGGITDENACGLSISETGFIYMTGSFQNKVTFESKSGANKTVTWTTGENIFTAKYNDAGVFIWNNTGGGVGSNLGLKTCLGKNNSLYVAGNMACCNGGTATFGTLSIKNDRLWGGYVAKCDTNGTWLWVNGMGAMANEAFSDCVTDNQDNVYIFGHYSGNSSLSSSPPGVSITLNSIGAFDMVLAKFNQNGVLQWAKAMGGSGDDISRDMKLNSTGNLIISGQFSNVASFNGISLTSSGQGDVFIVELSAATGNAISGIAAGGPGDDHGLGVDLDSKDHIYCAGHFSGTAMFGPVSLTSSGLADCFFAKLAPPSPFDIIAYPDTSLQCGDSVVLYPRNAAQNNGYGYRWFKDNLLLPAETNDTLITRTPGTYKLVITNECSESDTSQAIIITSNGRPPVSAGADTSVCANDSIRLQASGADLYLWNRLPGIRDTSISNPWVSPLVTTAYIVTGIKGMCSATDTVLVTIKTSLPVFAGADTSICINDSIRLQAFGAYSYHWDKLPGIRDTFVANPWVKPFVTTAYIVTGKTVGCTASDTVLVSVQTPPLVFAGTDTSVCINDSVRLQATGATAYFWDRLPGIKDTAVANPYVNPLVNTFYIVTGTQGVCSAKDTVLVRASQSPVIFAGNDTTICKGDSLKIPATAQLAYQLKWHPALSLDSDTVINPVATPHNTIMYILSASDAASKCTSVDTIIIAVNNPIASFTVSPLIGIKPMSVVFANNSFPGELQYKWSFGDSLDSDLKNPTHIFREAGVYRTLLEVFDAYGCSDTFSVTIEARNSSKIYIPNIITPNGDGLNEFFQVIYDPLAVKEVKGAIWDRWGGFVYSFSIPSGAWWNGKLNGVDCPDGVYCYIIDVVELTGTVKHFSGTVTLLR